ncbi:uncharacterized protein LOC129718508 [Wyeomyia smithii]|uniref:uncharacterized protein LOC129718508 n=1 Tax=Wyeomyia smithii TaxID=174621 RepID=UPI00246817A6|nr:uncharacterized protein LOC129718508 [Wyeomyia smithii]
MATVLKVPFYQNVEHRYGIHAKNMLKDYANTISKLGSMLSRKSFLIRCRKTGVFPAHITTNFRFVFPLLEDNSPFTKKLEKCINKFKKSVLNIEIKHTFHKLKILKQLQYTLTEKINNSNIPKNVAESFFNSQTKFENKHTQEKSKNTKRKFDRILDRNIQPSSTIPVCKSNAIHNSTQKSLPKETEILLSLGQKFALPTNITHIPFYHLLADIESILKTNPDVSIQDRTRCAIANSVQNYIHYNKNNTEKGELTKFCEKAIKTTKQFFRENPDVLTIQSDKGNKTVIMLAEDYKQKMLSMLNDNKTYLPIPRDPTSRYQRTNNEFAKRLLNLNLIDKQTATRLTTYNAICPRIYGQPKAHKPNVPLRPVVPNMTAPAYNLSKFIGKIIQNSIDSPYNIKDSFTFCNFICSVTLPPDYILISLDVISLFTSIPKALVTHHIITQWEKIKVNTNINLDLFIEIAEFCIESSYFKYNEQHFQQVFGAAMGNPLSPIIADLVMETLLDTVTQSLNFKPPFIKKYVDDLLLAIPESQIGHVLETFNSYNEHIQFTYEMENNKRLPFLDMTLIRQENQKIQTEWYMKPISSGRFLDYNSFHPLHQKINMAKNFIRRVDKLSTHLQDADKARIIHQQLSLNNYPKSLRNRLINRRQENIITLQESSDENLKYTYRSIPYIPYLSNRIDKHLKNEYKNIRLAHRNIKTVGQLLPKVKDPVPQEHQNNVIYKIPCKNCDACYVGMTTNMLKTRISGHRTYYNTWDKLLQQGYNATDPQISSLKEKTALMYHSITQNHRFDFHQTKIIDRHDKPHALPFIEVCHIANTENSINKRTDTEGLNTVYAGIIHTIRNINHNKTDKHNNQYATTT